MTVRPTTTALVPCGSCRVCCEREMLFLHTELGDDPSTFDCYVAPDGRFVVRQKPNLECVYLGPNGCTIYERRPVICREFDCRMFVRDNEAAEFLRRMFPDTAAKVIPAALALVARMEKSRQEIKRMRAIPSKRRRRAKG